MNVLNIKYGLFDSKNPVYWFKDLQIYFQRLHFLLKNGYSPMWQWEYPSCMMQISKEVFEELRFNRHGDMLFAEVPEEKWTEANDAYYEELLADLAKMQQIDDGIYEFGTLLGSEEIVKEVSTRFFKNLNEHFFSLWD